MNFTSEFVNFGPQQESTIMNYGHKMSLIIINIYFLFIFNYD